MGTTTKRKRDLSRAKQIAEIAKVWAETADRIAIAALRIGIGFTCVGSTGLLAADVIPKLLG